MQEYLLRIRDNDVLRAVEKNSSGSRPKELFEEVLEDVDKQWDTDRYGLGTALQCPTVPPVFTVIALDLMLCTWS